MKNIKNLDQARKYTERIIERAINLDISTASICYLLVKFEPLNKHELIETIEEMNDREFLTEKAYKMLIDDAWKAINGIKLKI